MNIEKELQKAIETANKANEAVLELKKKYEESLKPKSKVWKPKGMDEVWFPDGYGKPSKSTYFHTVHELYMLGELFPTEEACQKYIDKTLATQRVKNKILELNGDWEPDWKDSQQVKCSICYDWGYDEFCVRYCFVVHESSVLPYANEEACEYVIKNMQDDLKIIWDIK